jgi:nucleotide-binding universal stress UspA family protein
LIEKLLVALDGSKSANNALDFALDLAEKYSANVILLTVVDAAPVPLTVYAPPGTQPVAPVFVDSYLEELKKRHEKMLAEALKRSKKSKPSLKISKKLVEGRPPDKIVETAKEGEFDLVVMGSRGLGGIKEFFLGSVSDRVADEAPCPVLIVK